MFYSRKILSILLSVIMLTVVFTSCSGEVSETEAVTDAVVETESETSEPVDEGDPVYGKFDDGYGWSSLSAYAPDVSYYIDEGGSLIALVDRATERIATRIVSINGITSKAIFVTTLDGELNALTHEGDLITTIADGVASGAALDAGDLTIYYGKGSEPVIIYGYDLTSDSEAVIFSDERIDTGLTDEGEVYSFMTVFEYDRNRGEVDLYMEYPYGSEFPYERYLTLSDCEVTYDDLEHLDSEGNPQSRNVTDVLYDDGQNSYFVESTVTNGYVEEFAFYASTAGSTKTKLSSSNVDSSASANGRLYYVSDGNLYMINIGTAEWNLIRSDTQVDELFAFGNTLYGLVNTDGEYCMYELDADGKYVDTVWETMAIGAASEDWVGCDGTAAGRYVILRPQNAEGSELIAVFDMETKGAVAH